MLDLIQNIDFLIIDFIRENLSSDLMDKIMVFFTTLGNAGALWIFAGIVMLCTKKYRKTAIMMIVGLTIGLVLGNFILKPLVGRLRPFQLKEGIELLITAPKDFSYPSGHTLASVISAVIILLTHKKIGYWALGVAILIAFSRLYLYVHFPTDIIGGALIGTLIAFVSVKIVNYLYNKNDKI